MASWPLKARSTKAEFQPGDITCPCGPTQYQNASGLDEGRGLIPGDTPPCPERYEFADALNEGRGVDPRRHSFPWAGPAGMTATLNEGRGLIPGDTSNAFLLLVRGSALNEGRGLIPGDTISQALQWAIPFAAQRRPGLDPRRHINPVGSAGVNV